MKSTSKICLIFGFAIVGGWIAFKLYGLPGETSLDVAERNVKAQWKPSAPVMTKPRQHTNVDAVQ